MGQLCGSLSVTLTCIDCGTAPGGFPDTLTLGLDGIDTGILLNGLDVTAPRTFSGTVSPAVSTALLVALADGKLEGTIISSSSAHNNIGLPSDSFTTLTLSGTTLDTTPPFISSVIASPTVLWPPNHKMVRVAVSVSATDDSGAAPVCQIAAVASNEPIDGLGDGDTAPDWEITGALSLNLRAERSGTGNGRIYTITVRCTDGSGNSSTNAAAVAVLKSQGK